jgi:hypothetical protein
VRWLVFCVLFFLRVLRPHWALRVRWPVVAVALTCASMARVGLSAEGLKPALRERLIAHLRSHRGDEGCPARAQARRALESMQGRALMRLRWWACRLVESMQGRALMRLRWSAWHLVGVSVCRSAGVPVCRLACHLVGVSVSWSVSRSLGWTVCQADGVSVGRCVDVVGHLVSW